MRDGDTTEFLELKCCKFIRTFRGGKRDKTACAASIIVVETDLPFDGKRVLAARVTAAMTAENPDVIVARRQRFRPRFADFRFFYNAGIVWRRRWVRRRVAESRCGWITFINSVTLKRI